MFYKYRHHTWIDTYKTKGTMYFVDFAFENKEFMVHNVMRI